MIVYLQSFKSLPIVYKILKWKLPISHITGSQVKITYHEPCLFKQRGFHTENPVKDSRSNIALLITIKKVVRFIFVLHFLKFVTY